MSDKSHSHPPSKKKEASQAASQQGSESEEAPPRDNPRKVPAQGSSPAPGNGRSESTTTPSKWDVPDVTPLKVLALFDMDRNSPDGHDFADEFKLPSWEAEDDVFKALKVLGHSIHPIGVYDSFNHLFRAIESFQPDIVFNLMEQYNNDPAMDANVAGLLELLGLPYTGCSPQGLRLCKDKAMAKKVLTYHGIPTPEFQVFLAGKAIRRNGLEFPILVKPLIEDASYGIAQASLVNDDKALEERVRFLQENEGHDVIAEKYIDGRELYVALVGGNRVKVFPPRELNFGDLPEGSAHIATYKTKWDENYRKRWNMQNVFAQDLEDSTLRKIDATCRGAYRALGLRAYARVDLRLDKDLNPYVIEVNPNPYIAEEEDFALSAARGGLSYPKLIQTLLDLALSR